MRPLRAAAVVIGHFVAVMVVLLIIWAGEQLIFYLWGDSNPMFFNALRVKWIIDSIDLSLLLYFGVCGLREAHFTFRT